MGGFGVGALVALVILTTLAVVAAALRRRIAVVAVVGPSMQPALTAGDRVLVRRAGISELRPGQIVVFEKPGDDGAWVTEPPRWPAGQREWMIKRVAAVPGDRLPAVMLPGAMPPEVMPPGAMPPVMVRPAEPSVPAGKLVVLGDNAARSRDSREIGYIPAERLLGVMLRRLP